MRRFHPFSTHCALTSAVGSCFDGDPETRGGAFTRSSVVRGLDGKIVLLTSGEFPIRGDHSRFRVDFEPVNGSPRGVKALVKYSTVYYSID